MRDNSSSRWWRGGGHLVLYFILSLHSRLQVISFSPHLSSSNMQTTLQSSLYPPSHPHLPSPTPPATLLLPSPLSLTLTSYSPPLPPLLHTLCPKYLKVVLLLAHKRVINMRKIEAFICLNHKGRRDTRGKE